MWNLTSFRLEIVLVSVQIGARFVPNLLEAHKLFWTHLMVPLGDEAQVEACFGPLEKVLIMTQDSCTVFAEHTIGWEIILDVPDGTPM